MWDDKGTGRPSLMAHVSDCARLGRYGCCAIEMDADGRAASPKRTRGERRLAFSAGGALAAWVGPGRLHDDAQLAVAPERTRQRQSSKLRAVACAR